MSLEEKFEKHPYEAECVCKLCDWRRGAVPKHVDRPIGGFSAIQGHAIQNICRTQEEIQAAWDAPRVFTMPSLPGRRALIVTVVVKDATGYNWMTCVRLFNPKKNKVKPPDQLNPIERIAIGLILNNELLGVGHDDRKLFNSQWAVHMTAKVTGEELGKALKPDILGGGGAQPAQIQSREEALKLVDKLEKDLEGNERPRIIIPNLN